MVKRLTVVFVVSLLFLCILIGGAFSAVDHNQSKWKRINTPLDDGSKYAPSSKYSFPARGEADCFDITPQHYLDDPNGASVIDHQHYGDTWYDFQKNGSMGRMISVTSDGYVHGSWHWTEDEYPGTERNVRAQCADATHSFWVKPGVLVGRTGVASGYSNQTHMSDGKALVIYHEAAYGQYCMLAYDAADTICFGGYTRKWDMPDGIIGAPSDEEMMWPKGEVQWDPDAEKEYIHYIGTEGNTAGGVPVLIAYTRCYFGLNDTLICESYDAGTPIENRIPMMPALHGGQIGHFDTSCSITCIVAVSPVSKKVAIAWLHPACDGTCDYGSDIYYIESNSCGDEWVDGTNWPPSWALGAPINLTNFGCDGTERAYNDLSVCYDYKDSLHIVFVTAGFDPAQPGYWGPYEARLWHWSKEHGISWINQNITTDASFGGHNAAIAKMSVSARDPSYYDDTDSTYLYVTWTQFNDNERAADEYTSGDLYGAGTYTGGEYWDRSWNLTNTNIGTNVPEDCDPGECLSEHWSSMALNMYDDHLHIQYICDQDAGGAIQEETSQWMNNPVMYLEMNHWKIKGGPRGYYREISPAHWYQPPLRVPPGGTRVLELEINSVGSENMYYNTYPLHGCMSGGGSNTLAPRTSEIVTFNINGTGTCEDSMILGSIYLTKQEGAGYTEDTIRVYAICGDDYYECPTDEETYDTLRNGTLKVYVNSNCEEKVFWERPFPHDSLHEVFFEGGTIVATTMDGDTMVGRYMYNDRRTGARSKMYTDSCAFPFEYDYLTAWSSGAFIFPQHLDPPEYHKWWWLEVDKQIKLFNDVSQHEAYDHFMIKYVTVRYNNPPDWWPGDPTFGGFNDIYVGVAEDIDAPSQEDSAGQSARNYCGYESDKHIAWQQGVDSLGGSAEYAYEKCYAGVALGVGRDGESEDPYGTFCCRNDSFLYPHSGWGWDEQELYEICMKGTDGEIQDYFSGDSIFDRATIVTANYIPAHTPEDPGVIATFTVIKAIAEEGGYPVQDGLTRLRAFIDTARAVLAVEKANKTYIPSLCGDATRDGSVDVGDVTYLINYLFKLGQPVWKDVKCPQAHADVTGDGSVDVGDVTKLINYLFKLGQPVWDIPRCRGVAFY